MLSGSWSLAGTNKMKPIRKVTRVPSPSAPCRGGRGMSLLLHWGLRDRWRPRGPVPRLRIAWRSRMLLASWAAAAHAFVDPKRRLGHEPRRNRGDPYVVHFWFYGRNTCSSNSRMHKRPGRERDGKTPATKPGQGSSPASSLPCRVSGPSLHLCGIAHQRTRRSRSQWECARSGVARFRPRATSRKPRRPVPHAARILLQADAPPFRALEPVTVVAKIASILDRCRGARSPEEKVSETPAVAPTRARFSEVLIGGSSREKAL